MKSLAWRREERVARDGRGRSLLLATLTLLGGRAARRRLAVRIVLVAFALLIAGGREFPGVQEVSAGVPTVTATPTFTPSNTDTPTPTPTMTDTPTATETPG
ncbi:MAG TPA: hypothetical protein VJA66_11675, partial [Thermoanaerobaculia bacterium]